MALNTEKASALLADVKVARSRRTNSLTPREIQDILSALVEGEVFTPDQIPAPETATKVTWIGQDQGRQVEYEDSTKRGVMDAWVSDLEVSRANVKSIRLNTGSYMATVATGPGKVSVLMLTRSDLMAAQNPEEEEEKEESESGEGETPDETGEEETSVA